MCTLRAKNKSRANRQRRPKELDHETLERKQPWHSDAVEMCFDLCSTVIQTGLGTDLWDSRAF